MGIDKELIEKLLADYKGPEDLIGEQGLLKQLTKALVERAMHAELTHHLGYEKHDSGGKGSGNARNGTSTKTLKGDFGEASVATAPSSTGNLWNPANCGLVSPRSNGAGSLSYRCRCTMCSEITAKRADRRLSTR